jgi:hypothetical protein
MPGTAQLTKWSTTDTFKDQTWLNTIASLKHASFFEPTRLSGALDILGNIRLGGCQGKMLCLIAVNHLLRPKRFYNSLSGNTYLTQLRN